MCKRNFIFGSLGHIVLRISLQLAHRVYNVSLNKFISNKKAT